jgi:hypothetical protein
VDYLDCNVSKGSKIDDRNRMDVQVYAVLCGLATIGLSAAQMISIGTSLYVIFPSGLASVGIDKVPRPPRTGEYHIS